jgi:hypothetical protein
MELAKNKERKLVIEKDGNFHQLIGMKTCKGTLKPNLRPYLSQTSSPFSLPQEWQVHKTFSSTSLMTLDRY